MWAVLCARSALAQPVDAATGLPATPFAARVREELRRRTNMSTWTTSEAGLRFALGGATPPTTSEAEERFALGGEVPPTSAPRLRIAVNASARFQRLIGFGGAFTDAATINLASLPAAERAAVLDWYFHAEEGIGYGTGRVPVASTDFSTSDYSYDDVAGDFDLAHFSVAVDEASGKLRLVADALARHPGLKLFGTAWSAPAWMKTTRSMEGGALAANASDAWARYLSAFASAYEAALGTKLWGLTAQNEPLQDPGWQSMAFSGETERAPGQDSQRLLSRPLSTRFG